VKSVAPVQTNIVIFYLQETIAEATFVATLRERGVHCISLGQGCLSMVTHLDVSMSQIEQVRDVLAGLKFQG
jgi:threonine aldolase